MRLYGGRRALQAAVVVQCRWLRRRSAGVARLRSRQEHIKPKVLQHTPWELAHNDNDNGKWYVSETQCGCARHHCLAPATHTMTCTEHDSRTSLAERDSVRSPSSL